MQQTVKLSLMEQPRCYRGKFIRISIHISRLIYLLICFFSRFGEVIIKSKMVNLYQARLKREIQLFTQNHLVLIYLTLNF